MAYSKIILNGETLMDVTSDTVDAGNLLSGKTATKNSGAKVTGNIATKSSSDLTVSGATVTAPAGYYSATASKAVATTTHPNPTATIASSTGVVTASHTQGTGYVTGGTTTGTLNLTTQAAQTINTSTADQTIASNRWLTGMQTIKSVTTTNLTAANIAEGVTVKVGDANNASRITQITGTHSGGIEHTATINGAGNSTYCYVQHNGTKYYTNGTTFTFKEGDTITFFVRGDSDSYITYGDGTIAEATSTAGVSYNYIALGDDLGIYFNYNGSTQQNSIAFYLINVSLENSQVTPTEQYQYVTPSSAYAIQVVTVNPISSTYVGTGVAKKSSNDTTFASATGTFTAPIGYYSAAATKTITTQAAQTIYPSTADQTIASYKWLTGTQTIKSVTTSNLTAANIAEGVVVKVGDANNASRISQVTGTFAGGGGAGFTADAIATRMISGDISGSATTIGAYAFHFCTSLTTATFPNATTISSNAFYICSSLATISFPNATIIGVSAFYKCNILKVASFPSATTIGDFAFCSCSSLTTISFPNATTIGSNAFGYCTSLTTADFPNLLTTSTNAFRSCKNLTVASFPKLSIISTYVFYSCSNLTTLSFPSATTIGNYAFGNCFKLLSLYLLGSSVASLGNVNAFASTPISTYTTQTGGVYGSIYVPSSLYNSYTTAAVWSIYSSRFVSV